MAENICISEYDTLAGPSFQSQAFSSFSGHEEMRAKIGIEPTETSLPQGASELIFFYNSALQNIESLRVPPLLPVLMAPLESAETPQVKKYYHGSPEEQLLQALLDNAKQSGNRGRIERTRENLQSYWRKIIDAEYSGVDGSGFTQELKKLKKSHKESPRDPFIQYRLHALAQQAQECNSQGVLSEIEKIRNGGTLRHSSPIGDAIADFADGHATGSGSQCYAFVADALDTAGINLSGGSAYMAADQLARHPDVREIKGVSQAMLPSLPKGTIVVWNCGEGHSDGHISISLGNGKEASDTIRDQITGYGTSFRVFAPLDMIEE